MGTQFTTVAAVNARLDQGATVDATLLGAIIDASTAQIAQWCNRWERGTNLLLRKAARTEYPRSWGGNYLQLDVYPIESITSVTVALDRDYDNGDSLTEDTDYVADYSMGGLYKEYLNWSTIRKAVKVVYSAGYVDPASVAGEGQTALPADIQEAAIRQTIHLFKTRLAPGVRSQGMDDGSMTFYDARDLLESVKALVRPYRRVVIP